MVLKNCCSSPSSVWAMWVSRDPMWTRQRLTITELMGSWRRFNMQTSRQNLTDKHVTFNHTDKWLQKVRLWPFLLCTFKLWLTGLVTRQRVTSHCIESDKWNQRGQKVALWGHRGAPVIVNHVVSRSGLACRLDNACQPVLWQLLRDTCTLWAWLSLDVLSLQLMNLK